MLESLLKNPYEIAAIILFGIGFTSLMLQKNMIKKIIGFNIMDVNSYWQQIIRGVILVIAISFNNRDAISFKRKEKAA